MSLTAETLRERKWGWLPALRTVLESKGIPGHYWGASTASDNVFERVSRLIEINILVEENRDLIVENLKGEGRQRLTEDLRRLQHALRGVGKMLQNSDEQIQSILSSH